MLPAGGIPIELTGDGPCAGGPPGFTGPSPSFHASGTTPEPWHVLQTWVSIDPVPEHGGQAFSPVPGERTLCLGTADGVTGFGAITLPPCE